MRRWLVTAVAAAALLWVGWVVWLLASPPTLKAVGMPKQLACQPVGRGTGEISMMGVASDDEGAFVDSYAKDEVAGNIPLEKMEPGLLVDVTRACSTARTDRLVSLMTVVGAGLALLVVGSGLVVVGRLSRTGAHGPDPILATEDDEPSGVEPRDGARPPALGRSWRLTLARRRGMVVIFAALMVWIVWLAWLLLSSPTVEQAGVPGRLVCQPVGRGFDQMAMLTTSSDDHDFVVAYVEKRTGLSGRELWSRLGDDEYRLAEVSRVCAEARTNRTASLVAVGGTGLALLVVGITVVVVRRLPRSVGWESHEVEGK